jgi:CRP-like cAMP-binding protein
MEAIELSVTVDMDAAPTRAKEVLVDAVRSCPKALQDPPPIVQLAAFAESGATYRVRYFIEDYNFARASKDEVLTSIWYALRRAGIEMPYPQQTVSFRERAADADERRRREHFAEAHDLLSRIDFVAALSNEGRRILAERARFQEFGPGQPVVRQGEQGDTFYLVARGEVAVRVLTDAGEKEMARLGRGAYFGEMSLLTGEPRTATVLATAEAALLAVDRDAFERVFAQDPNVGQELATVIARRRLALESAHAEGAAPSALVEKETSNLLDRIKSMFGRVRATG